jgi:hypothetical protein
MGLFNRDKKSNAVQINEVNQNYTGWSPYIWFHKKGDKPLGNVYLQAIMNVIWKGLSNVTFEDTGKETITVNAITDFVESNTTLLVNQYLRLGFICVFYDKDRNYRIPQDSEIRYDKFSRVINTHAVVIYSPQYQTEKTSLFRIALPIIADINKMAGAEDYLTETLGCFGILSGQDIPINPAGKEQLLSQMTEKYGIADGKYKFMLANHDIKYTPIEPDIKNLEFREKIKDHYKVLANLFGVPLPLLFDDAATYNNVKEARIFFYNNTIRYYAEVLLKVAKHLITASNDFIPQSAVTYRLANLPELETTLSAACEERTALLDYLLKLKTAGLDVEKELSQLYMESRDLLKRV